ncbi:MAG: ATP synthase F0 subunit B [Kofleriaceae bacterium]|nr:ATP synthase F0 subunit B [Kofleriaceae bacterium]
MTQPVLQLATGAIASAAEHPIIDIDATAFIQFGIFVIMALFSTKLLFKPYLKMREERDAGMDGARKDAENLSAEADAKLADYEEKLANARALAQEERRKMRDEAAEHLQDITDKARAASVSAIQAANKKVVSEMEAARAELLPKVDTLAAEITSKLLRRKVA